MGAPDTSGGTRRIGKAVLFLAPLLAAGLVFGYGHRGDGRALSEVDALLAKGAGEHEACRRFLGTLHEARDRAGEIDGGRAHPSKKAALEIAALLERYPGWAPSYSEAADYFDFREAELSRNVFQPSLVARRMRIEPECGMLEFYRQSLMLLEDLRRYAFSPDDKRRIRKTIAAYLTAEPRFRSFLEGGVKAALLAAYLDEPGKKSEHAKAKALGETFEKMYREVWGEQKRQPLSWLRLTLRTRELESRKARELFRDYYRVLREAQL